ncbi:MAG: hypothetical protein FWB91_02030 [Defluviitaleaceae bacterium]|nr:hypothetical protein [Defluviitaleaceae bacterium]
MKNLMQKIQDTQGAINNHYSMSWGQMEEIKNNSEGTLAIIVNSFAFGYMQGVKAAKAAGRKVAKL